MRRRRTPEEQRITDATRDYHDVLIVAPEGIHQSTEFVRVPVVKMKPDSVGQAGGDSVPSPGEYVDPPELIDMYDYSGRRVLTIARPQDWGDAGLRNVKRGPAFGTLPVKREPAATACLACFLIDIGNLNFYNAWTAEEWNDIDPENLPASPTVDDTNFEVLLAGPRGMVFHLKVDLSDGCWSNAVKQLPDGAGSIESVELRHEMEIWNQLRNGCVVGRVAKHKGGSKVLPLVNVTSLIVVDPKDGGPAPGHMPPATDETNPVIQGGTR